MGYDFNDHEITVNQDSFSKVEKHTNQNDGKTLMDKNQLMNIYLTGLKRIEDNLKMLDCSDAKWRRVDSIDMKDSRFCYSKLGSIRSLIS
jgi:hypothetical protein